MYGKKPPFSMKPHFRTLNPTNMPADFPRLNTPSGQNFPSLQQFSIFSLPPKQSSSISSNDMQYITPGKYAVLGFFADSHKTTETDRLMATQIGNYFFCHTCGRRPRADEKFTPDHQPPSCIFTELPHELGYSHQFWEFKYGGWLFQTTNITIPQSLGVNYTSSVFGEKQFLYPQCRECSNKQGSVCRQMLNK